MTDPKPRIPILAFARSYLGIHLYKWQAKILETYATGNHTAVAAANYTGKTSTVFPAAALWTLYCHPTARVMYLSATGAQVEKQFFAAMARFRLCPAFAGWTWLSSEVRTPSGGFLFGRSTDTLDCLNPTALENHFRCKVFIIMTQNLHCRTAVA